MIDLTPIIVALIVATPAFLAWRSSKKNGVSVKENGAAVKEVHLLVNSRLDELLRVSKANSKAEGVVEGRAEEKGEQDERTKT